MGKKEPVLILALIQSIIALVIGFGVNLTVAQGGLVMAVSAAVLGLLARSQVTPMAGPTKPT